MLIDMNNLDIKSDVFARPWRGVVVSNNDPKKIGRIKVVVEGLLEGEADVLPWCSYDDQSTVGSSSTIGNLYVPKIGTEVRVTFPFKDIHFPFYVGPWKSESNVPSDFKDNYPNILGMVEDGFKFLVDREQNTVLIETPNSVRLKINSDGSIELNNPSDITINSGGNTNVNVSGDTTLTTSNANINTSGATNINAGGNVSAQVGGNLDAQVSGNADVIAGGVVTVDGSKIILGSEGSGITTNNSHLGVVDLITGVSVLPSTKTFGDI